MTVVEEALHVHADCRVKRGNAGEPYPDGQARQRHYGGIDLLVI